MNNDAENNESLKDALHSYGLKQNINRVHKEMMEKMRAERPARVRSIFSNFQKIAAAVLLLIIGAGVFVYFTSTPQNLFNSAYKPYEISAQRGGNAQPGEVKQKFLEGQDLLRSGDAAGAIVTFTEILGINSRSADKVLNDDTEYYLALAYLKNNQPEPALTILQNIHNNKDHLYNDQVTSWFLTRVKIARWRNQ